jgi:HK97 family phage major capsid protein
MRTKPYQFHDPEVARMASAAKALGARMADPVTPVSTGSFEGYPFPAEVLAMVWTTLLTGSPFAQALTPLPTSSGRVAFPVVAPTGGDWVAEGAPLPETDLHDSAYVIGCCKLAALMALSNESLSDEVVPISALVGQAIQASLGPVMDDGLLHGDGTPPQPDGIMSHVTAAAAGTDFRHAVITAAGELGDAGASASNLVAFAKPSTIAAEWARTAVSSGVPLHPDSPAGGAMTIGQGIRMVGVPKMGADVLVADVSQCFLVVRESLQLELSNQYFFGSDSAALRIKTRVAVGCPTPLKSLRKIVITP